MHAFPAQEPVITFKYDGTVEINPKYTVDEAAKKFWDSVKVLVERDGHKVLVNDA